MDIPNDIPKGMETQKSNFPSFQRVTLHCFAKNRWQNQPQQVTIYHPKNILQGISSYEWLVRMMIILSFLLW